MKKKLTIIILFFLSLTANATTWTETKLTDPLTGEKVKSSAIMSYGSYIYSWPSKFDLVFWPVTDEKYITINLKSGYGAFNSDFEKLSEKFKDPLKEWLKDNYNPENPPLNHKEKLLWLEKIYGQIEKNESFWKYFYRLMTFLHSDDKEKRLEYINKTLSIMDKEDLKSIKGMEKIETLYILGEYNRRKGNNAVAEEFFKRCLDTEYMEKGAAKKEHPYFKKLIEDRRKKMD